MKKIINKFGLLCATAALLFSCSDADNVVYDVFDSQTYGAVLRKIDIINQSYSLNDPDSFFAIDLEEQDEQYGKLLSEVKVYATYTDKDGDINDNSVAETLYTTLPVSSFSTGSRGLPTISFSVTLGEVTSALGVTNFNVGDTFLYRFELLLTDGRSYSAESTSGSLQGSYFSSPFSYGVPILCQPKPGDYIVEMHDSYGDGWQTDNGNGGSGIKITLTNADDTETVLEVGMCSPYGGSNEGTFSDESLGGCTGPASTNFYDATGSITIPEGTKLAVWSFPGDQYGEISFEIYAPDGTELLVVGLGEGQEGVLEVLNCL